MDNEPIPFREGEAPPSSRHVRAILKHEDGSPDQEVWIDPETLNQGPLRQEEIDDLLPFLRWQWRPLGKYATWCRSFEDWELGFMRDSHPAIEVGQWMKCAYAMLEFSHRNPTTDQKAVFQAVVQLSNCNDEGIKPKSVATELKQLMANPPMAMTDPNNFTEDGKYKAGEKHLR